MPSVICTPVGDTERVGDEIESTMLTLAVLKWKAEASTLAGNVMIRNHLLYVVSLMAIDDGTRTPDRKNEYCKQ